MFQSPVPHLTTVSQGKLQAEIHSCPQVKYPCSKPVFTQPTLAWQVSSKKYYTKLNKVQQMD